jgi:predicted nucleic acid-binding protein
MKLALDTSAYSAAARGEPRSVALVQAALHVYLPFVVLAELRAGFRPNVKAALRSGTRS